MLNICLFARSGQNIIYGEISKLLPNFEYKSFFVVHNKKEEDNLLKLNVLGKVYNLFAFTKYNWNNEILLNSVDIKSKELEYDIESIWALFYMDRFLVKYNTEDAIKFIKLHILFYEEIISIERPDYYINEEIAMFSSYLFYMMGKKVNCKYIGFAVPRNFVNSNIQFVNNSDQNFYQLNEKYKQTDIKDCEEAKKMINQFIEEKSIPAYMLTSGRKPKLQFDYSILILKYLYSLFFLKKDKYDYENYKNHNVYLKPISNYIKYIFQKRYFQKPLEGQINFIFPLHYQPEATTLVNAPLYEKQLYAIDLIAKSIPGNSLLYVKEHYAQLGHRESGFYKKLKNYPNVRLISPWCSSHDLIQKSAGVIVLTSTMGWEALFYGKPVFVLGNVFYDSFKYINKIKNIQELPKAIKNVLANPIDKNQYKNEFYRYVQAYLNSMSEGGYCLGEKDTNSIENIKKLTLSLVNQFVYFEKKNSIT